LIRLKNLTSKPKLITIIIITVLFCVGFLLGTFVGISRKNSDIKEMNEINTNTSQLDNQNNKVTTIDLEKTFEIDGETKRVTLNQEEMYEIFNIIDNLEYTKNTCDGLPNYMIKYNSENEQCFINYGVETYTSTYHITTEEKGEAILSQEQLIKMNEIIEKYFPTEE
jgi:hypothetical protein